MANTYTVNHQTVLGSWRAHAATVTLTDGPGTTSTYAINTGFNTVIYAVADGAIAAAPLTYSGANLYVNTVASAHTAVSGDSLKVLVIGQ